MLTVEEIDQYLTTRDGDIPPLRRVEIAERVRETLVNGESAQIAVQRYVDRIKQQTVEKLVALGVPEEARGETASRIQYDVLAGESVEVAIARHMPVPTATATTPTRCSVTIDADEPRMTAETIAAIHERGGVYQRGGKIVEPRLIPASPGDGQQRITRQTASWQISEADSSRVRSIAATACEFMGVNKKGDPVEKNVPKWLPRAIMSELSWPFPVLSGIAEVPTMRPDGSIITEPGFDKATGIYLASTLQVTVPEKPSLAVAKRAGEMLLDVVRDFPFVQEAGKSVFLSGILSVVARPAIDGPVPMHLVDASMRGSGKSKLVDVASIITTGRPASRMTYSADDVEMDKRITSLGLAGDQLVLIDNVVGEIGCQSLDMALTSTLYRGRILGKTEMSPHMPMHIVWWATGNGMIIDLDLTRRAVLARLEPRQEHPEERTGFKYPRLLQHVAQHRVELLSAALTMVHAYVVAGRPNMNLKAMDYDAWTDLVRSTIVWAGFSDPYETVAMVRASSPKDEAFQAAVAYWPVDDGVEVTAAQLVDLAKEPLGLFHSSDDSVEARKAKAAEHEAEKARRARWRAALVEFVRPLKGSDLPEATALGRALRSKKGAIVGSYRIEGGSHGEFGVPWKRVKVA